MPFAIISAMMRRSSSVIPGSAASGPRRTDISGWSVGPEMVGIAGLIVIFGRPFVVTQAIGVFGGAGTRGHACDWLAADSRMVG